MYKQIILSKIYDYCKKVDHPAKKTGKVVMLKCPFCEDETLTANIIPNTNLINCLKCNEKYDLLGLIRELNPDMIQTPDEEILTNIKELLKLDIETPKEQHHIADLLNRFQNDGFCLVPCAKKEKNPIQNDWTNKENRSKEEWEGWLSNGLNVGVRTGIVSGVTVIDLDLLTANEKVLLVKSGTPKNKIEEILKKKTDYFNKIKYLIGDPWVQETHGGYHLFYKYVKMPKTRLNMANMEDDNPLKGEYYIDLENDGGQVVVEPSKEVNVYEYIETDGKKKQVLVGSAKRAFINNNPLIDIPEAFLELLKKGNPIQPVTNDKSTLAQRLEAPNKIDQMGMGLLGDGDGRNVFFTSYGGYLRHQLNPNQVRYALTGLDKMICDPRLDGEIDNIVKHLETYHKSDLNKLENEVLDYLILAEQASKPEIEVAIFGKRVTGEQKKLFDECIANLCNARSLVRIGRNYKVVQAMQWTDNITDVGIPIDFKMPYFQDYAYFNWGDLILIGGTTKVGKTTLAMNIVKRLVDQGIKPYYIYSENGARWSKSAMKLGMKDGDFFKSYSADINQVEFKKGRNVTVWDWIDIPDFTKTNLYFNNICTKLEESQGICIAFVQLKEPTKDQKEPQWFAPNLIRQKVSLGIKFVYESEDGKMGKFKLSDIRDAKPHGKNFLIPTIFDRNNHTLLSAEEAEKNK